MKQKRDLVIMKKNEHETKEREKKKEEKREVFKFSHF